MKIAVCVSGQMRDFKSKIPSWSEHLFERNDCDVFVSTWAESGISTDVNRLFPKGVGAYYASELENGAESFVEKYKTLFPGYKPNSHVSIADIHSYPNVRGVIVENLPRNYETEKTLFGISYPKKLQELFPRRYHNLSMFFKIDQCNRLKTDYENKHGFKYDLVIRIRPDIELTDSLIPKDLKINDQLFIKKGTKDPDYIFDQCFMGSSTVMDSVCNVWGDLSKYWNPDFDGSWPYANRTIGNLLHYHVHAKGYRTEAIKFKTTLGSSHSEDYTDFDKYIDRLSCYLDKTEQIEKNILNAIQWGVSHKAISLYEESPKKSYDELSRNIIVAGVTLSHPPFGLGWYHLEERNYSKAAEYFKVSHELEPDKKMVTKKLMEALYGAGRLSELNILIEKLLLKGSEDILGLCIDFLKKQKKHTSIINIYDVFKVNVKFDDNSLYKVGLSYFSEKDFRVAMKVFQSLSGENKTILGLSYYKCAQIHKLLGEKGKAFELISKAIVLDSKAVNLLNFKYSLMVERNMFNSIISDLADLNGAEVVKNYYLSKSYIGLNDYLLAKTFLDKLFIEEHSYRDVEAMLIACESQLKEVS